MGDEGFKVRRYLPEDREKLIDVVGKVWDQPMADRLRLLWDWKYEQNPQNPPDGHKSLVMVHEGEPVGFLGYLSVDVKVGEKIEPMAWGSELSILPEHRGHGWLLLKYVTEHSEKICSGSSIPRKIYLIYKKLGSVDVCTYVSVKKALNARRFLAQKYPNPLMAGLGAVALKLVYGGLKIARLGRASGVKVRSITEFDERFDELWERVSPAYDMITVRNAANLNWRFFAIPNRTYEVLCAERRGELAGYLVIRHEDQDGLRRGHLVDLLTERGDFGAVAALLDEAQRRFKRAGVDVVSFVTSEYAADTLELLKKCGYLFKTRGKDLIAHSGGTEYYRKLIKRFEHAPDYYLTRADTDTDYMY